LYARLEKLNRTLKPDKELNKRIDKNGSLIEGWCKKKIVFALLFLPFGTVFDPQTKICKRVQFSNPQMILYI
jgi:hypothetical protein